jgi:hypothetical protein
MSKMSLPCSLEKLRHEVRLISKRDLRIISGAEIARYRNKQERKNGTEDNNVPPEDMADDQTTTIQTNVNARLGTVKPTQRSNVCGNEKDTHSKIIVVKQERYNCRNTIYIVHERRDERSVGLVDLTLKVGLALSGFESLDKKTLPGKLDTDDQKETLQPVHNNPPPPRKQGPTPVNVKVGLASPGFESPCKKTLLGRSDTGDQKEILEPVEQLYSPLREEKQQRSAGMVLATPKNIHDNKSTEQERAVEHRNDTPSTDTLAIDTHKVKAHSQSTQNSHRPDRKLQYKQLQQTTSLAPRRAPNSQRLPKLPAIFYAPAATGGAYKPFCSDPTDCETQRPPPPKNVYGHANGANGRRTIYDVR